MTAAARRERPAPKAASGRYARLDEEYLLQIRPHLTANEARVYELLVLKCDGWARPVNAALIAQIAPMHIDTVRRAMRRLEALGLIQSDWFGPEQCPTPARTITILRDYRTARLAAQPGLDVNTRKTGDRIARPRSSGSGDPDSLDRAIPSHLIARSDPDLPSLPSRELSPPNAESETRTATEGGTEAKSVRDRGTGPMTEAGMGAELVPERIEDVPAKDATRPRGAPEPSMSPTTATEVPEALVTLARQLWGNDVAFKAVRRYLQRVLAVGDPHATPEELARYLRWAAKTARVQRARFPIAVACMPEECADWLARSRQLRLVQSTAPPPQSAPPSGLSLSELGRRAEQLCARLARTEPRTPLAPPVEAGAASHHNKDLSP